MPWQKGQSGNPSGRVKGYAELEALARSHAPAAITALVKALGDEKLCVAAATALLDRGFGRAVQRIDANVNVLDKMSDAGLTSLLAAIEAVGDGSRDYPGGSPTAH